MAFYKNNSIDNEMVKKNLETIHENTYDNEDKCFQWEIGELKTDDGKTVLAFKKLPKKESQTDR